MAIRYTAQVRFFPWIVMNTWVEISRSAVEQSVQNYRSLAPESGFMAVVKSNAYGHGLKEMTSILIPLHERGDVAGLAVNSIREALEVRSFGFKGTVLIMGRNDDSDYGQIPESETDFHIVLSTSDDIEGLQNNRPNLPFHLKVDTGMSRLGVHDDTLDSVLSYLKQNTALRWRGLMTHFANVEDVMDQGYGRLQLERFQQAMEKARTAHQEFAGELIVHSAASAPALLLPEARQDWIRVGISLYGFWPSSSTRLSARTLMGSEIPEFRPALSWKARIVHCNEVGQGVDVGYGCTYRTTAPTRIAVLPVGYYEGYDRSLSNRSHVLIRGRRAPLLGRVCMNMIMVDVTSIPGCSVGDVATLIGTDGSESVSADELADLAGTINYETVTRIEPHLPRIIVD
ncbi:MAG: alanine racemase [Leptospiraceae bacterium]|nr:alanine racemase [Leptospiraceae bacterium]